MRCPPRWTRLLAAPRVAVRRPTRVRRYARERGPRGPGAVVGCLLVLGVVTGCASSSPPRVPPPPVLGGAAPAAQPPRAARPTPGPEVRTAVASGDVVEAGLAYVAALYAADDATAALYQPGYGELLRKDEDKFELLDLTARPMSWGEAGYADADPSLEFAEVVARVRARDGSLAGAAYYKLGFRREGEALTLDLTARRLDVR